MVVKHDAKKPTSFDRKWRFSTDLICVVISVDKCNFNLANTQHIQIVIYIYYYEYQVQSNIKNIFLKDSTKKIQNSKI